jgi:hypothetical protein
MLARADSAETTLWLQPGQLWSFWDMIPLKLRELLDGVSLVSQMHQMFMTLDMTGVCKTGAMNVESLGAVLAAAEKLLTLAKEADLDSTEACAERLRDFILQLRAAHLKTGRVPDSDHDIRQVEILLANAKQALADQLGRRFALILSRDEAALFKAETPVYGQEVFDKFRTSQRDIEEAGRCLALGRNKASVFHLMLAMEEAVRRLAQEANANVYDKNGQFDRWMVIVGNLKAAIPSLPADRQDAWMEVHNLRWGVGKVWRNGTMHPAETYSDYEAKVIFDAVGNFMRYLAPLV